MTSLRRYDQMLTECTGGKCKKRNCHRCITHLSTWYFDASETHYGSFPRIGRIDVNECILRYLNPLCSAWVDYA